MFTKMSLLSNPPLVETLTAAVIVCLKHFDIVYQTPEDCELTQLGVWGLVSCVAVVEKLEWKMICG